MIHVLKLIDWTDKTLTVRIVVFNIVITAVFLFLTNKSRLVRIFQIVAMFFYLL